MPPRAKDQPATAEAKPEINKIAPGLRPLAIPIRKLTHDPMNAREHPEDNMAAIRESLSRYGQLKPLVVRRKGMVVMAGNGTLAAARSLGWTEIAANVVEMDETEAIGYGIADNRTAELAVWNLEVMGKLDLLLREAGENPIGWSSDQLEKLRLTNWLPPVVVPPVKLSDRFMVPPFSVLNAREGWWQNRKQAWIALGIRSELGRGVNVLDMSAAMAGITDPAEVAKWNENRRRQAKAIASPGGSPLPLVTDGSGGYQSRKAAPGGTPRPATRLGADGKTVRGDGAGRPLRAIPGGETGKNSAYLFRTAEGYRATQKEQPTQQGPARAYNIGLKASPENNWELADDAGSGTSIFDPVLCELVYRWFCPPGGVILDPFAGGSVRGIVAGKLGRQYVGVDLSLPQVAANREQASICAGGRDEPKPKWHAGDSREIGRIAPGKYDLVFSCPPYADLEVYSDDPRDISTMEYEDFRRVLAEIVAASVAMLRPDRFAAFVVGEVRGPDGAYRNLVGDTIEAFRTAGLSFYNEAILVTAVGSLALRTGKQFETSRKFGKTHQNVLVFAKGDPRKATEAIGPVEMGDPADFADGGNQTTAGGNP